MTHSLHACHGSRGAIQRHSLLTRVAAAYLCLRLCRQLMSAKLSGRILKVARDQQEEIDAEALEAEHEARGQVQVSRRNGVLSPSGAWQAAGVLGMVLCGGNKGCRKLNTARQC